MKIEVKCSYCRDRIEGEPVKHRDKLYCSEACAFQDSVKTGSICGCGNTLEVCRRYRGQNQ